MNITTVLVWGLVASGFALLFRALPWPKKWLSKKPWSCATCLGFHGAWVALLTRAEWVSWADTATMYFSIGAVATILVTYVFPPLPDFNP